MKQEKRIASVETKQRENFWITKRQKKKDKGRT